MRFRTTPDELRTIAQAAEDAIPTGESYTGAESVVVYYSKTGERIATEVWVGEQTSVATIGENVTIARHGHARHLVDTAIRRAGAHRFETFRRTYDGRYAFQFSERVGA